MSDSKHIVELLRILQKDLSGDGEHYQASIVQRAASTLEAQAAWIGDADELAAAVHRALGHADKMDNAYAVDCADFAELASALRRFDARASLAQKQEG